MKESDPSLNWKSVDLTSPEGAALRKKLETESASSPLVPPKKLPPAFWGFSYKKHREKKQQEKLQKKPQNTQRG
jgi:hypothetical protein